MERAAQTKQDMAKELKSSRSQMDLLSAPAATAVSLETLTRAARVLGKRLILENSGSETRRGHRLDSELRIARALKRDIK